MLTLSSFDDIVVYINYNQLTFQFTSGEKYVS